MTQYPRALWDKEGRGEGRGRKRAVVRTSSNTFFNHSVPRGTFPPSHNDNVHTDPKYSLLRKCWASVILALRLITLKDYTLTKCF